MYMYVYMHVQLSSKMIHPKQTRMCVNFKYSAQSKHLSIKYIIIECMH